METKIFELNEDIEFIGFQVKDFPEGIPRAFSVLGKISASGRPRMLYSKSQPDKNGINYVVGIEVFDPSEASKFGFEQYLIPKGKYIASTILHWSSNLHLIQGVFDKLILDPRIDPKGFCVEWYKNDDEMVCMVNLANEN